LVFVLLVLKTYTVVTIEKNLNMPLRNGYSLV